MSLMCAVWDAPHAAGVTQDPGCGHPATLAPLQTDKQTPRRVVSPCTLGALATAEAAAGPSGGAGVASAAGNSATAELQPLTSAPAPAAQAPAPAPAAAPTWGALARSKQWHGAPALGQDGWRELLGGGYARVHVHPKRFPAVYAAGGLQGWRARVVAQGEGWVVVDKPAGVQVGAGGTAAALCPPASLAAAPPRLRVWPACAVRVCTWPG
jgi:hypothetical protein